jgi:hypothetical protein
MFQSFYYPDGWNSNTISIKELDEKDLRGVKDIDNALLNNNFLRSNNIAVTLCNRKNEIGDIKFFNRKDFHIQFGTLKYTKLFDKLYIPFIDKVASKEEASIRYYFVDLNKQTYYINSYPSHLANNIIQFIKFFLDKKSKKLTDKDSQELHDMSGFLNPKWF